jgi:hypothetical protein
VANAGIYQFPGLLNSPEMTLKPGGEPTVKLFRNYKACLDSLNLKEN